MIRNTHLRQASAILIGCAALALVGCVPSGYVRDYPQYRSYPNSGYIGGYTRKRLFRGYYPNSGYSGGYYPYSGYPGGYYPGSSYYGYTNRYFFDGYYPGRYYGFVPHGYYWNGLYPYPYRPRHPRQGHDGQDDDHDGQGSGGQGSDGQGPGGDGSGSRPAKTRRSPAGARCRTGTGGHFAEGALYPQPRYQATASKPATGRKSGCRQGTQ